MNGGSGYQGLIDMINGGGAGQAGQQFQGGGILSDIANAVAKPRGYYDRMQAPGGPMQAPMQIMQPVQPMPAPQPMVRPMPRPAPTPAPVVGSGMTPANAYAPPPRQPMSSGMTPANNYAASLSFEDFRRMLGDAAGKYDRETEMDAYRRFITQNAARSYNGM